MSFNILVDADIPLVERYFSPYGEVRAVPGHRIGRSDVAWADALIVRSVTRIDRQLLGGSRVGFVGSATAGVDHVDQDWLRDADIRFAAAEGANASAVADYVLSALGMAVHTRAIADWPHVCVGVVGYGHAGALVAARLERLGCSVLVSDPPKTAAGSMCRDSVPLNALLKEVSVLSLHASLTREGAWPTAGLFDSGRLARLPRGSVLIQSSRGGIMDDLAAADMRRQGHLSFLALDVWEGEPVPDPTVVDLTDLATPHIAGYTTSAKRGGVERVVRALRKYMGLSAEEAPAFDRSAPVFPVPDMSRQDGRWPGSAAAFSWLTRQLYDIRQDDALLRQAVTRAASARAIGERFHALRASYGTRPGYGEYRLETHDARWRELFDAVTLGVPDYDDDLTS